MVEKKPLIIGKRFLLKKKIGSGSFGIVYEAIDLNTSESVAVKIEQIKESKREFSSLVKENHIYSTLKKNKGIPNRYWFTSDKNYNILVIQLLGKDLSNLMQTVKKFSLMTISLLAEQLITTLEKIHENFIIHRDLKPENLLMDIKNANQIHIIDFGISKYWKDSNGNHIPFKENKPFIGTTRYASISAHFGREVSRKDDLESLGYVLIFLYKGKLPWQNIKPHDNEKNKKVGKIKACINLEELCFELPREFIEYFKYLRKLQFMDEPNYSFLRSLFNKIKDKLVLKGKKQFLDWERKIFDINSNSRSFDKNDKTIKFKIENNVKKEKKEKIHIHKKSNSSNFLEIPKNIISTSINDKSLVSSIDVKNSYNDIDDILNNENSLNFFLSYNNNIKLLKKK